ncbi:MAG: VWA domain-containing protein [Chloroflexi bacterium]|nr:VWA domain-containing protein [Chloroflexota bacterium]
MSLKRYSSLILFIAILALTSLACGVFGGLGDGIPNDAVVVNVTASKSLQPWLDTAVTQFNNSETETAAGNPVYVILNPVEAGQAVTDMAGGTDTTLWIPDQQVWVNVLADQGNPDFQGNCQSVAQSPLVIGMWQDAAAALGWPGLPLGWLDIGSLAADPAAWNYYSGGELGDNFRMGHTHPGLSATGANTLLAVVQAAQSKTNAVSAEDIQQPIVQASVGAFEGGVTWFSQDSADLGQTMSERGINYLTAGVMYESDVVNYGGGNLVAIYPLEGTFMADFPACVNQSASTEEQEAAELFREYLLNEEGQQAALANGLRPVNPAVPLGPPLDEAHGVNPNQPEVVFAPPSVKTVYAVQDLWQEARKDVNLVMALDTSGSMSGSKMSNMREAAVQFVEQMGDDDYISIISFNTEPYLLVEHAQVGPNRNKIINAINGLYADGDTTLFDAIGDAGAVLSRTTLPSTANALVVLTDGQDTRSYRYDESTAVNEAIANNATVFTIAYGRDADEYTLSALAERANGKFFQGDEASIDAIYDEMSAAFGGNVGVGR